MNFTVTITDRDEGTFTVTTTGGQVPSDDAIAESAGALFGTPLAMVHFVEEGATPSERKYRSTFYRK